MKPRLVYLIPIVLAAQAAPLPLEGHWQGVMLAKRASLPVRFDFTRGPAKLDGRFTSASQAVMDYPLDSVTTTSSTCTWVLGGGIRFEGSLQDNRITGTFTGGDGPGTFTLQRTPAPRLPYRLREVTFANGPVTLAGTLVLPAIPGRHPAAVLLHGSGPQTRWGTNRYIADRLARAGVAAVIYDKRGSGASTGDWKTADFDDLARDALGAVAFLQKQPGIDPRRIGLHGHSQGGTIAAAAARLAHSSVAFLVAEDSVAGPVWRQDLYRVRTALAKRFQPADVEAALRHYTLFLEVALQKRPYSDLEAASAPVATRPWFAWLAIPPRDSWLWPWYAKTGNVDTLDLWREVKAPTLLVYGERDELLPVSESIEKIESELDSHGVPYTALIAPRAEHNLTIHPRPGRPFFFWKSAPGLIDIVAAWIAASRPLESTTRSAARIHYNGNVDHGRKDQNRARGSVRRRLGRQA